MGKSRVIGEDVLKQPHVKGHQTPNSQAYVFLSDIMRAEAENHEPLVEYQNQIGEMLRNRELTDKVKMQAAETLADLVANDPAKADKEAVRRLAKFAIHGPSSDRGSDQFNPLNMLTKTVSALTGYASEAQDLDWEEQDIFNRVGETAQKHGVPSGKIKKLNVALNAAVS